MITITETEPDPDYWVLKLGLVVLRHRGGEKGRRYPSDLITLRDDLSPVEARCTLMHEIGHHIYDHHPTSNPWLHRRQEAKAWAWAVDQLITAKAYAAAEQHHGPHLGAIAQELEVTRKVATIWRDNHRKRVHLNNEIHENAM